MRRAQILKVAATKWIHDRFQFVLQSNGSVLVMQDIVIFLVIAI